MKYEELKKITCAGIVLYNPEIDKLQKNIDALYEQVDSLVLVDNSSKNLNEVKKVLSAYSRIIYIENTSNLGIAEALNQILQYAEEQGYEWYLSMDQDSVCSKTIIKTYAEFIEKDDLAVLCPYVLNNNKITLSEYKKLELKATEYITQPIDCITSGSLNKVAAAKKIGGYNSELFIDCVDVDFNLRLSLLNYKILRVNSTYMVQSMGEARSVGAFQVLYKMTGKNVFKRLRYTPVYSDNRLYYIARNSRYIREKYGKLAGKRMSAMWMMEQFIYYMLTYPLSHSRITMLRAIRKGSADSRALK